MIRHRKVLWVLSVLAVVSCRQPIEVDASGAKFIPRDLAVEELKELLPTAEVVRCSKPRLVAGTKEIKSWDIKDTGVEFQVEGKEPLRFAFADVTAVKINRLHIYYEVRIFTPAEPRAWKEHFRFNWKTEAPARRTFELIEALRSKSEPASEK